MYCQSQPAAQAATMALAVFVFFLVSIVLPLAEAASIEHVFIVNQMKMTCLCKETVVTLVNGQLPGPTIEITEGDSVTVHVVNRSPYNITIHWHGVKQFQNCWVDGVPMITQCPITPNKNFTYQFNVVGQEGTLWWHAHVPGLRATLHGAFIIRPRHGADSYPFPKPHKEIPVIIGDWWEKDLAEMAMNMTKNIFSAYASASTVNGLVGDYFNCSGVAKEGFVLDVEPGKTYLLQIINAGLFSEFYLKIAGHKFTVVAADANYVNPFTTDVIAIAPGETVDAMLIADAPPGRYYMVALPNQAPLPDVQTPEYATRGMVKYKGEHKKEEGHRGTSSDVPIGPKMPDVHDTITSFYFHGNLTSLHHKGHLLAQQRVDEHLFRVLGLGTICKQGQFCKRGNSSDDIQVATMNNVSFQQPTAMTMPLLEAQYYHISLNSTAQELPKRPPILFNFTDEALIPFGPKEMLLEPTYKATLVRRFKHGAMVEIVFQSTTMLQGDSNPMHLHGHNMMVVAQGLGNYDPVKDVPSYNLVNPVVKNTVLVPNRGWIAIRFVANNPGVWFMHCHYEFHLVMGMVAVFIVENGPTIDTSLPPPPDNFPTCGSKINPTPKEFYLQSKKSET
ncbi:hypothetical protein HU200_044158 [Digitaria exilis]|uniref:laccase n=1 Tax=Digitaria exilis TaxID=1010633 RepID=A0A835ED93_9POAL|nr:hypothetical protein HU200_044158 [Digitaria exilis]